MTRRLVAFVTVVLLAPGAGAVDPIDLMKYFPSQVNSVCVVNVAQILSSPRAVKEKWDKIGHTEYLAGAVPVHPNVDRLLVMSEYAPSHTGHAAAVSVLSTKQPADLSRLAAQFGTEVTTAGGEPAVVTPRGFAFIKLGEKLIGAMGTEHKPDVARFVNYAKTATVSGQSKYLNAVVNNDGLRSHILIAVDVEDMIGPKDAENAVALTTLPKQDEAAANDVRTFVAGLRGVRVAITVTEGGINVVVRLDSSVGLKVPPDWVKAFVMESLARIGAVLEDMPAAVAKTGENFVTLSFRVTDPELAYVMALVLPPAVAGGGQDAIAVAPQKVTLEATQKYFKTVNQVVDDLKKKNQKAKVYTETALWHDSSATKIDTISPIGVDPIALEYGRGTSQYLRSLADSLRGIPVEASVLQSKTYYYVQQGPSFRFAPFYGLRFNMWARETNTITNLPEMQQKLYEAVRKDEENRAKIWEKIDAERPVVKVKLNEKFKGGF